MPNVSVRRLSFQRKKSTALLFEQAEDEIESYREAGWNFYEARAQV